MRWLINDKGMMFGNRINIIDFLVVIFILSLMPMFWSGWKIFNKPPQPPLSSSLKIDMKEVHIFEQDYVQDKLYQQICRQKIEINNLQGKIDNFLKEHKRAGKHFK